jgi:fumarate reductase flavoprotein subunit
MGPKMKLTLTVFSEEMIPKFGGTLEEAEAGVRKGSFASADSIAELADKIDVPADVLVDTNNMHNQYLADGKDPEFNKPITKAMVPVLEGPFYAVAQWLAVHHCMGGQRIKPEAQVVDIFGDVIPRRYSAGEVCGATLFPIASSSAVRRVPTPPRKKRYNV